MENYADTEYLTRNVTHLELVLNEIMPTGWDLVPWDEVENYIREALPRTEVTIAEPKQKNRFSEIPLAYAKHRRAERLTEIWGQDKERGWGYELQKFLILAPYKLAQARYAGASSKEVVWVATKPRRWMEPERLPYPVAFTRGAWALHQNLVYLEALQRHGKHGIQSHVKARAWTITHTPTGMGVLFSPVKGRAMEVVRALHAWEKALREEDLQILYCQDPLERSPAKLPGLQTLANAGTQFCSNGGSLSDCLV